MDSQIMRKFFILIGVLSGMIVLRAYQINRWRVQDNSKRVSSLYVIDNKWRVAPSLYDLSCFLIDYHK